MIVPGEPAALYFTHAWTDQERVLAFVRQRESSSVFEALGLLHFVSRFASYIEGVRLLLEIDSEPVAQAVEKAYSPKPAIMRIVKSIFLRLCELRVCIRVSHLLRSLNFIADALSLDDVQAARCLMAKEFGLALRPCPM